MGSLCQDAISAISKRVFISGKHGIRTHIDFKRTRFPGVRSQPYLPTFQFIYAERVGIEPTQAFTSHRLAIWDFTGQSTFHVYK